jgi:ketosteroid isomerase-like protein
MVDGGGGERTQRGRYVIVWRETEPGVWKMHVDTWSAAPPRP